MKIRDFPDEMVTFGETVDLTLKRFELETHLQAQSPSE